MAEGLVTLTTDLKSLKYNSMPLGSEKPYVTKNIGQAPQSQLGLQVTRRVDDLSRISQMLIDKPGLKFIGNQALLQQTDSLEKLQKASDKGLRGIAREGLQIAKNTVIGTAKILGSTLAQVPVNGTGTHFVYGFRTDTYLQPANQGPITAFASFFGAGGVNGAPLALRGETISGEVESNFGKKISNSEFKLNIDTPLDYGTPNKEKVERGAKDKAQAGQPIYLGEIPTTITPFLPTEGPSEIIPLRETTAISGSIGISNQNVTGYYIGPDRVLQPTGSFYKPGKETGYLEDTERGVKRSLNGKRPARRETRINLGDQGAINVDVNDPYQEARRTNNYIVSSKNRDEVDKLNALDIQSSGRADGVDDARDLAKFFFEIITPDSNRFINFRAFITSMDDSYNANWDTVKYVGRGEEFYTYGGFSRDINIGFKIAAATRSEMRPLYRKMVLLASATAPTYGEQGFMRGTFVRLSLGSYFNQIPGVLTSVKYTWNTDYPWEIALSEPEGGEGGVQELPMVMDCSISFKPVHDFVPQTGLYNYITSKDKQQFFNNGDQI